ncbi:MULTISPECIES: hypothetical protein [Actinomyces]|uniref:hypothetical protein n=1 Tax=Actinomyces TaxID=1654 RepID=UPI001177BA2E|nr:hypothetical protein [Actinomyces oris]
MLRFILRTIFIIATGLIGSGIIIYGIPYVLLTSPFFAVDATSTLKQRLPNEHTRALDIRYSQGSPKFSRDGPSGSVIGYISDAEKRHKLLANQLFADCSGGCSSWQSYSELDNDEASALQSDEKSLPSGLRSTLRMATGKDSHCIARYHPGPHSEVFCLSLSTGAFVYGYDET